MTRIKELRLMFGITQKELAKKLNIAQNTLSTWETGKFEPDICALNRLAEIFNVSTDYLLARSITFSTTYRINGLWKSLRKKYNLSQADVASRLGITRQAYANYERGIRQAGYDTLLKLSEIFNVSTNYLLGQNNSLYPIEYQGGIAIPILKHIQEGIYFDPDNIIGYEQISRNMADESEFFAFKIKDNSMEPKFTEGDVVIVRKQSTASDGDIVIALVNGDDATIKKIKIRPEGIILTPLNSQYEPMFYNNDEIETLPVTIIGKVVELRAKF